MVTQHCQICGSFCLPVVVISIDILIWVMIQIMTLFQRWALGVFLCRTYARSPHLIYRKDKLWKVKKISRFWEDITTKLIHMHARVSGTSLELSFVISNSLLLIVRNISDCSRIKRLSSGVRTATVKTLLSFDPLPIYFSLQIVPSIINSVIGNAPDGKLDWRY
jgi:hypothetical protein